VWFHAAGEPRGYAEGVARDGTHSVQAQHRFEARSAEVFDRIAYAMQLLAILKPQMTVAVYGRNRHIEVQRSRGRSAPWALLGIPPHATRESIAAALVELSGLQERPFLTDLLCAQPLSTAAE
jgi:hypothetical protein